MAVEVKLNIDRDLQERARLIYVPLGYASAFAAIAAVDGGLDERIHEDEYQLLKEADDNIWGSKLQTVGQKSTPITKVQSYLTDRGGLMKRSGIALVSSLRQAKQVYAALGFASLKEAYEHRDSDKLMTRIQRSDIIDGYYALTDSIDLSAIKEKNIEDTYRQYAREMASNLDFNSVPQAYRAIEIWEPKFEAKEIAQFKTGWQIISEGRKERKARKNQDTAKVYTGGTTTKHYPSRVVSNYSTAGTMPRPNYRPWNDDDYEDGYGWSYGTGRGSWTRQENVAEWQKITASYIAARNEGESEVYIGTQTVPAEPISVEVVQGDEPVTVVAKENNLEMADDSLCDAALAMGEINLSLKKLISALGLKDPGNDAVNLPFETALGKLVEDMVGDNDNEARRKVASSIVLSIRQMDSLKYHFERIEEYVAQESAYQYDTNERKPLAEEMKLLDSGDKLVYPTEEDESGDYVPRINEPVEEFLSRVSNDSRDDERFDG